MGVFLDGVQRRTVGVAPMGQAAMALPRPRHLVAMPPSDRLNSIDGLVRRVTAAPQPIGVVEAVAPLPTAQPLTSGASWYLPAALAAVTVGIAAGALRLEASNLPSLNLASLLPRTGATAHTVASQKPDQARITTNTAATASASLTATQQAMQNVLTQRAAAAGVPTGIMTIDLKTGAIASSNADAIFTSASLYKLFVAKAVYAGIDAGTIRSTDTVPGTNMSVQNCLNQMITVSSNPCGEALGSMVGWDSQNASLRAAGFAHTSLHQYANEQTSASDVALLLRKLYNGSLLSSSSSTAFINLLKAQQINDRLPVGLPAGVSVAHKTGDLNGLVHDAGIIYAPGGNYIAVAMSGPWGNTNQAYSWFGGFSDALYSAVASTRSAR